jgi:hypothetical protein
MALLDATASSIPCDPRERQGYDGKLHRFLHIYSRTRTTCARCPHAFLGYREVILHALSETM